jgi:addiction module HigA family antidote
MLIEEFLQPLGISQSEFARHIGVSFPRLNEIINGKRSVTPDTALRLERALGMEAQFWLNLQLRWDLYRAIHSPEAEQIGRIAPIDTHRAAPLAKAATARVRSARGAPPRVANEDPT